MLSKSQCDIPTPVRCLVIGTKEVAVLLGTSERTAHRLLRDKSIRAFKMRGCWRTTTAMVTDYVNTQIGQAAGYRPPPLPPL